MNWNWDDASRFLFFVLCCVVLLCSLLWVFIHDGLNQVDSDTISDGLFRLAKEDRCSATDLAALVNRKMREHYNRLKVFVQANNDMAEFDRLEAQHNRRLKCTAQIVAHKIERIRGGQQTTRFPGFPRRR